jgi:hypothetical protein
MDLLIITLVNTGKVSLKEIYQGTFIKISLPDFINIYKMSLITCVRAFHGLPSAKAVFLVPISMLVGRGNVYGV